MKQPIAAEAYLLDPCGTCATAHWKSVEMAVPDGIRVVHARDDVTLDDHERTTKYFRLLHDLKDCQPPQLGAQYAFRDVDPHTEKDAVIEFINDCYGFNLPLECADEWMQYRVYDPGCWVFVIDMNTGTPAALGIADFDAEIGEGSLEWIQVQAAYRGLGLGSAIVNELLRRLKARARFVTVSGQVDNATHPEALYRKCGFRGDDIWHVIEPEASRR